MLSWKDHFSSACKKVSRCIAIINKAKYILGKGSLSYLYTSIIEQYLTYCVEVWGNAYKSNLNPLYLKQKCLIRLITKSVFLDHTANLFQSLTILPSFHLIKYKIAIFMNETIYSLLFASSH